MSNSVLSFGNIVTDGRLVELVKAFQILGLDTKNVICTTTNKNDKSYTSIVIKGKYLSPVNYIRFFVASVHQCRKLQPNDICVIDNFWAAPIGLLLRRIKKNVFLVQDCRECYDVKDIKSRFGRYLVNKEIQLMKLADIVIEANEERAAFVKEKYNLRKKPFVFENVRFLPDSESNINGSKNVEIDVHNFNVVSTGGVSVERGTLELVKSFVKLPSKFHLFIIGGGTEQDIQKTQQLINDSGLAGRVNLVGRVPLYELTKIVRKCQVGVVHYHKKDFNNIYCASGKVYEYIGCGIPIVTTSNDSLVNICKKYQIGESGDSFNESIMKVYNNYEWYLTNVLHMKKQIRPELNRELLATYVKNEHKKFLNDRK